MHRATLWAMLLVACVITIGVQPTQAATLNVPSQYATIQAAINAATPGDTINVAAGTYAENVIVNKSVSLIGPNAGINPNTDARNPEAIIMPAVDAVFTNISTVVRLFSGVSGGTLSNVIIDGFSVDGDNPNNGAPGSVDAALGIGDLPVSHDFPAGWATNLQNITIRNNIVHNLYNNGIALRSYDTTSTGNYVTNNKIDNLLYLANWSDPVATPCWDGVGIFLRCNVYGQVVGNHITHAQTGIIYSFHYLTAGNFTSLISDNYIECYRAGIFNDLESASPFTIMNNTIIGKPDPTYGLIAGGIWFISFGVNNQPPISGNTIKNCKYGIFFWNCHGTATEWPTFEGGLLKDNVYGVYATNYTSWWDQYVDHINGGLSTKAFLSGLDIQDSTGAGIYLDDHGSYPNCPQQLVVQDGTSISGGARNILVEGAQNSLLVNDNGGAPALYLSGPSGDFITLQSNPAFFCPGDLDARKIRFDGKLGTEMTWTEYAAVTQKITEKRNNSILGNVTLFDPLASVSLGMSQASPKPVGTPITLTATSIGGCLQEYKFREGYQDASGWHWRDIQGFGPSNACSWTPPSARTFTLVAYARQIGRTTPYDAYTTQTFKATAAPLTAVNLGATPVAPRAANTPITLTATPVGGSTVEYKFRAGYQDAGGWHWSDLTNYQTATTYQWTPATPHTYTLVVWAREAGRTNAYDAWSSMSYRVTPAPITAVDLTAAPTAPQKINTPITLTASVTGGSNVEYRIRVGYYDVTGWQWTDLQSYGPGTSCTWTPSVNKTYTLVVYAREVGHTVAYDAAKSMNYLITR